ncbi:hypothetical protein D1816_04785 [Aquimarina sp. AD10]|uniref:Oxidase n=1 Tax=Aquimarina aggregata TaxID=1642818 RepID=A0A162CUD6_9FLAO|nr:MULTISPECIES: hypothetical protein [Aquimarina]AXT59699.1 hypothetical protein D1816_04785 [Aquimarina sp. AD10]KZS42314.1 hypothetical protein AWE51_02415 [Aquimarina aggregata]RKM97575.1 hypothetical protein D7033_14365 [Aquimarina sp. AD10]
MKDFKLDNNRDLVIKNGDFAIGDTDQQNIELLLLSHKGSFKEHPILGVGITDYLKSPEIISRLRLENEISNQLEYDNFFIKDLDVNNLENIHIDGNY